MADARPLTREAVAIIERFVDGEYQVLFAQRPAGKGRTPELEFPVEDRGWRVSD